jgi:hypothetical protein
MAFDAKPTEVIASWSEDATNVTFPIASVPELTAAEADAVTGDSRKVIFALMERFYAWYNGLATADKPTKMTISRSTGINDSTGIMTKTFALTFTCAILTQDVSAES